MPEHLKALVVILVLATLTFRFFSMPAFALGNHTDFLRRRNLWFAITLVAFLSHSFWLYALAASLVFLYAASKEPNKVALFFAMLMVIPSVDSEIPGFGVINYLFALNHVRILELIVLLPAFLKLMHDPQAPRFGRLTTDKILASYILLVLILAFRQGTFTDILRQWFYLSIDIVLPYFVISRSLRTSQDFRDAMSAFVIASAVVASISIFEAVRHWHLYRAVADAMGTPLDTLSVVERSGRLRAMGPTGHPIVGGYIMTVAFGLYLYLKDYIPSKTHRLAGLLLLLGGLAAPISRGPWMGAAVLVVIYLALGRNALKHLATLALASVFALAIASVLPGGQKVVDVLPFIGSVEKGSIDYRAKMLDAAEIVIMRNPLFGSTDFALQPEMQAMKQGRGIIDIVNSYLIFALQFGLVGVGLFVLIFLSGAWGVFKVLLKIKDKNSDVARLGRSLLATLLGVMLIIFTVSPISLIPLVYWSLIAMTVAFVQVFKR